MTKEAPPNFVNKGLQIPMETIKRAIDNTDSMQQAAESLDVSFPTFKKYALKFGLFKPVTIYNYSGKKYRRGRWTGRNRLGTMQQKKIMDSLVKEGKIEAKCCNCDFNLQRTYDYKAPLMIHFKDGDRYNHENNNVELYCYNCWYLLWTLKRRTKLSSPYRAGEQKVVKKVIITEEDKKAKQMGKSLADAFSKT